MTRRDARVCGWTFGLLLAAGAAKAETCTTQSQMKAADRDGLSAAASLLAGKMQAGDAAGVRGLSVAEVAKDFAGVSDAVEATALRLKGAAPAVEQVYLLDATTLKPGAGGGAADAQFYCTLNRSVNEAEFLIPALPPGRYGFAVVDGRGATPWRLSFLLRQEDGRWLMAGLYPKALTAAGHDGLWYWTEARKLAGQKQAWNAWLYLREAETLLQPAPFVGSTHLDKLRTETTSVAPPAAAEGVTADTPLVVKAKDGTEFRVTALGVDDSLNTPRADVAVHLKVDPLADPAAARKRNIAAMSALLAAYPELRQPFHGVWVFAEAAGQPVYATEQAIGDIP